MGAESEATHRLASLVEAEQAMWRSQDLARKSPRQDFTADDPCLWTRASTGTPIGRMLQGRKMPSAWLGTTQREIHRFPESGGTH